MDASSLVPVEKASPLPAFTGADMIAAFQAYRDLQKALDDAMPDQIMRLDGKPFRKKGYWRAIAVAFNLTVEPVAGSEARKVAGRFEDGRANFGYLVTYRASTATGRSMAGDGSCFAVEKAARRDAWRVCPAGATEHNVRSHAHTRAFNRAVSNLVGFGEVSAEEIPAEGPELEAPPLIEWPAELEKPAPPAAVAGLAGSGGPVAGPARGLLTIRHISIKPTKKLDDYGRPFMRATITLSDGREPSTIDHVLTSKAQQLWHESAPVAVTTKETDYGLNLLTIREVPDQIPF